MNDQALKVAMAAVEQLPHKHQKLLVERLLTATVLQENTTVVYLRRLAPEKQVRLAELMDKNNDRQLSRTERLELKRLGAEVDQLRKSYSTTIDEVNYGFSSIAKKG